jgi:hypothetical protein
MAHTRKKLQFWSYWLKGEVLIHGLKREDRVQFLLHVPHLPATVLEVSVLLLRNKLKVGVLLHDDSTR